MNTQAQFDTLHINQPNSVSSGPLETPFPTGIAATARTSYLFSATELSQFPGLLACDVIGVLVDVLDTDPPGTTVDIELSLGNVIQQCASVPISVGLVTLGDTTGVHLQTGPLVIPVIPGSFCWSGGSFSLALDFQVTRNGGPGISPRLVMDSTYTYNCTPTTYAYQDSLMDPGLVSWGSSTYWGNSMKRPAVGLLRPLSVGLSPAGGPMQVAFYPVPAQDRISMRLIGGPEQVHVMLVDARGSLVDHARATASGNERIELPLTGLAPGPYVVLLTDVHGVLLGQERIVVL
ncbi:MAG: hypothetical protein JNL05_02475 [Flavobacteriales bacterium]|nr:hypothetical protein [Flavobacteriales bacterium]